MTTDLDNPPTGAQNVWMEARLARLEAHTERNTEELRFLRTDMASLRAELGEQRAEFRSELGSLRDALRTEMAAEFRDVRAASQRQFYWLLGAMVGLAGLMSRAAHWI